MFSSMSPGFFKYALLFLSVGIAGGCGALARLGITYVMNEWLARSFPWGTVTVNLLGCLLFGLVMGLIEGKMQLSPEMRTVLLTGFMGAFTTFSTYMFETQTLLQQGLWLQAMGNLTLQNVVGLLAVIGGLALGKAI
jgi:CrcB protein